MPATAELRPPRVTDPRSATTSVRLPTTIIAKGSPPTKASGIEETGVPEERGLRESDMRHDLDASTDRACRLDPSARPTAGRYTCGTPSTGNAHGGTAALTPTGSQAVAAPAVTREEKVARRPPSGSHGPPSDVLTVPAVADDTQYEYTSVQALRGTEAKAIAKWEKDGWEVDRRDQGVLRTELTFRRVKPKTFGATVLAAFRGLAPKVQLLAVSAGVLLLVLVVGVGVVFGTRGGGSSQPAASATDAGSSAEPSAAQAPAATSSAVAPTPAADEPLTVENNADMAALVAITDPSAPAVGEFAAKYRGRTIEFDGNIAYLNPHGSYTTRYDLLINAGDYSTTTFSGPNFQFRDVNITNDLHLTGPNIPDTIGAGNNLRIVATVGDYNSTQELLFLEPVRTEVR
jgi:hypothetical protein